MLIIKRLTALLALTVLCLPAARGAGQTIVVVGDSLSSGYGIAAEQSWVAMLEDRLQAEGYGYQVVNASIAGDTSAGGLARLPRLLELHDPALVVIELGGNDGLRGQPVATLRANLAKMIELSRASGARSRARRHADSAELRHGVHASTRRRVSRARGAVRRGADRVPARRTSRCSASSCSPTAFIRTPRVRRSCSRTFGACSARCSRAMPAKPWLGAYSPGVPAEIDPDTLSFASGAARGELRAVRARSPRSRISARRSTFADVERASRAFAAYLQAHAGRTTRRSRRDHGAEHAAVARRAIRHLARRAWSP